MPEIQKVSVKHEAIMDHLMTHPLEPLGTVAKAFNVSQPWLSCIIHSDAFQEMLRLKQGVAFHHTVLPIKEKMLNVAHQTLDRLVERIPFEDEPKNLSSIAADVLDRLGYSSRGPSVVINQQNNHVSLLREEIEAAQALLGRAPPPALEVAHNGDRAILALPHNGAGEEVQGNGHAGLGKTQPPAAFSFEDFLEPKSEVGDTVREGSQLAVGRAV